MLKRMRREEAMGLVAVLALCMGAAVPGFGQVGSTPSGTVAGAAGQVSSGAGSPARAFDVVSIKPIAPGGRPTHGWVGMQTHPDGVEFAYEGLRELIQNAYGAKRLPLADQITGLPDWANAQRYDIDAKMSADDIVEFQKLDKAGQEQWREAMVQAMLADRFQLKIHRGTRQAPVFELVVAKGGPKMKDAATDPNPPLGMGDDGKPHGGIRWEKDTSLVQGYSMEGLAGILSEPMSGLGRPVVDKTGLTGAYDFKFDWSVYSASVHRAQGDADSPAWDPVAAIFRAVGEIGLKLQPATGTLDTIAIDHVEKASEN